MVRGRTVSVRFHPSFHGELRLDERIVGAGVDADGKRAIGKLAVLNITVTW